MAGITYYVDNVGGNAANDGLTIGTAKSHPLDLVGIIGDLDVLRQKSTGTDYNWNAPSAAANVFSAIRILWTNYSTDTTNPRNVHIKNVANPTWSYVYFTSASNNIVNVDTYLDYNNSTNTASHLIVSNNASANVLFKNCYITMDKYKSGTPTNRTTAHQFTPTSNSSAKIQLESTTIDGLDHSNLFNFNAIGTNASIATRCSFIRFAISSSSILLSRFTTISKNIFDLAFQNNNSYLFRPQSTANSWYFRKNTIIIRSGGFTTSNCRVIDFITTPNNFSVDNVCINLDTGNTHYLYGSSTAATQNASDVWMSGNNPYYGFSYQVNITGLSEALGTSPSMASVPFLSTTLFNSNYALLDATNSDAIASCIQKAYADNTEDCGRYGTNTGGATPNAYDLRAGVVVGSVTGTLVVPAITDVRSGVNYDVAPNAKTGTVVVPTAANTKIGVAVDNSGTGTYDGSDRWTDPGQTNVRSGTAYKANSTTNNKTGSLDLPSVNDVRSGTTFDGLTKTGLLDLPAVADVKLGVSFDQLTKTGTLESTDPGVANVLSGVTYKINSSLLTGTKAFYPLLALNVVKIGTDRGDGSIGTYDGSERYTDLVLSNIKSSYSFRYNSLIDNRTGTHTEAVSTDPGETNVKSGVTYTINDVPKTGSHIEAVSTDPGVTNVKEGTTYTINDVPKTGTLHIETTDTILASELKYGVTKTIKDVVVNGTDIGADFNDDILPSKVELGFAYKNLGINKIGELTGGSCDYPTPEKVYSGTSYASGTKTGTLGNINQLDLDYISQMDSQANSLLQSVLGVEYQPLKYFKEPAKNDFYNSTKQFGIRCVSEAISKEKIGLETIDVIFEIKLTTDFIPHQEDDIDERQAELALTTQMENIRRHLRVSKFFFMNNVRIVKEYDRPEIEKISDNVLLCKALVKVNINVKNG